MKAHSEERMALEDRVFMEQLIVEALEVDNRFMVLGLEEVRLMMLERRRWRLILRCISHILLREKLAVVVNQTGDKQHLVETLDTKIIIEIKLSPKFAAFTVDNKKLEAGVKKHPKLPTTTQKQVAGAKTK